MAIFGYSDQLSVTTNETIRFMVSCDSSSKYRADIVRLFHGDISPEGPGFKEKLISTSISGEYPSKKQDIYSGSCVLVPDSPALQKVESLSLQAMVYPTTPNKGLQGLLTKWSNLINAGYGLFIDEDGCLSFWIGDNEGRIEKISTGKPMLAKCWYFVGVAFDEANSKVCIYQEAITSAVNNQVSIRHLADNTTTTVNCSTKIRPLANNNAPFIIGGYLEKVESGRMIVGGHYNGKIDRPRLSKRCLSCDEMKFLVENTSSNDLLAAWNFAVDMTTQGTSANKIIDESPNHLDGLAINLPTRGMTGYNWTSDEHNFTHAPEQYGAIYFHDDDLDDAGWEVSFELSIPDDMRSGLYAARLTTNDDEDYIPFYVRPKKGSPTARIAFLAPTASYMAYANDHTVTNAGMLETMIGRTPIMQKQDLYLAEHREYGLSTYDTHSDGSGVCYSSRLRPILNMRPKCRQSISSSSWQFNADLYLIDWLTEMDYEFDIITDEDLHLEGASLIEPYKVVLTGSHPEYCSAQMLNAIEAYQQNGGRLMYMGGNGFYWVTAYHPNNPNVIEVRKWGGTQAWKAQPGEYYLSFTGELGGIWRNRGRTPQKIVGTGFIAQGFDLSSYYRRKPDSFKPQAEWIFEGVSDDELIGNFGLVGGGAAGLELDIYDVDLGTPSHALVLASSEGHTDTYLEVVEELFCNIPGLGGSQNPKVRADLVYYTLPKGGSVFSVSSIAWSGSLSYNNYDNNVSRITNNVLKRFLLEEPLPLT
ncbi:LamG domain-containing protein [Aetokthonos hydrillicola Thurmond2011]|jgi:N,N-dimethylformamidase|uniref:LamG domain-containing protein n=1 Tax=Aetokthonos hydrillicola Thurmond2011 TaxID=2712845 RepID=A0AAP5I514_9CYAN|nr:N,N-dimethylformamidase beta subunit family domain-containing protein [Aetokthonos hydrillicola]MBO3460022.1 LamG domain-containing protein [Aetokthonos hydrillicola CCALA 1050]MBW4584619.1 LamG domain-containing protein [Aetokthonos hydrillicola CCALA 1050]MDR9895163.1 LamG domain-containing protein [Aetokthonos hydrillicola Thurmond2011]